MEIANSGGVDVEQTLTRVLQTLRGSEKVLRDSTGMSKKELVVVQALKLALGAATACAERTLTVLRDAEIIELTLVYNLIAEECARLLGHPESATLPAVLTLCGEADNKALSGGTAASPAIVSELAQKIIRITVDYLGKPGEEGTRDITIFYARDTEAIGRAKLTAVLPWQEMPGDVRDEILRTGADTVPFELFPGGR